MTHIGLIYVSFEQHQEQVCKDYILRWFLVLHRRIERGCAVSLTIWARVYIIRRLSASKTVEDLLFFIFSQEAEEAAAMEEFKLNQEGRFREEDEDDLEEEEEEPPGEKNFFPEI